MIILILISQYFYNNMRQVVTTFYLDPQLIIFSYLPLTFGHLDFVVEFFWKYCVNFKNFAHLLKKKIWI